jgi:pyruvate dehydrogenase E2 component (dihydrolipoamide acetyltransferase)
MAYEVTLPRLGWSMEKGTLVEWRKQPGEQVQAGEILFVVEADKASQEVEAFESGILYIPPGAPEPGTELPVGAVLGYLLAPGEAPPPAAMAAGAAAAEPTPAGAARPAGTAAPVPAPAVGREPAISPRARRAARELGVEWTALQGSGRTGRIVERDVRQAAASAAARPARAAAPSRVSPVARRMAHELGVDVAQLAAEAPGKRITRADVEAAAREPARPPVAAPPAGVPVPMSQVRRLTAERMAASAHTAAAVTLTTEADATELVRLRSQLKADGSGPVPTYNDLLAKIVAEALAEHPALNARIEGEAIVQAATINIGLAVDTERGLLVPVLRDVGSKRLPEIAVESAALVEAARTGRSEPDSLRGGTFTITNLGMYEIDAFTPIINLPECAILGVGRIVPKQAVVDAEAGRVAIRQMVFLSLTFDHRLVDGAPAARFLQRIKQYVEQPYLWLVR